jgi:uncharacterized protein (DUF1684 family)
MSIMPQDPFPYDRQDHEAVVAEWRRARLARLTAPDSWLSLVGRFPLKQGQNIAGSAESCDVVLPRERVPDLAGTFEVDGTAVRFTPASELALSLHTKAGAQQLTPGVAVTLKSDRESTPDKIALGSLTLEVMERSSGVFVRARDPENPTRRDFPGIEHYPIDPKWRVVARLEPYQPHKTIDLAYESGSAERYSSPGAAVFEIDGVSQRVDPVLDSNGKRLYLVFWDETARDTTYGAGRFLYAPLPVGDHVLLDFNQAFSPPCAFTPYALFPLAPPQNRLPLRVEAGEKSAH